MPVRPLRRVLSLQPFFALLVPMALAGILAALLILPQIKGDIATRQTELARAIASQVESYLETCAALAKGASSLHEEQTVPGEGYQRFLDAQLSTDNLSAIYCADHRGRVLAVGLGEKNRSRRQDLLNLDLSRNTLYRELKGTDRERWSDTFLSVVSGGISAAYLYRTPQRVIVAEINLASMTRFIGRIKSGEGLLVLIVDSKGQIIADQGGLFTARQRNIGHIPLVRKSLAGGAPTAEGFVFDGKEMTGTMVEIPAVKWRVLVARPTQLIYRSAFHTAALMTVALILALAGTLSVSLLLARKLSSRFEEVALRANTIASGNWNEPWPTSNIEEFNTLTENLTRMAGTLHRQEEKLRKSEEQFRSLVDNAPEAIYVHSSGRFRYLNRKMVQLLGASSAQELIDCEVADRLGAGSLRGDPADGPSGGGSRPAHYLTLQGASVPVETTAVPFRFQDRNSTLVFVRDVTERVLAEAERRRNELRMASLYKISQYRFVSEQELMDHALEEVIELTESRIGHIFYFDARSRELHLAAWSKAVMDECALVARPTRYRLEETGLWGEGVRLGKPCVTNDYRGETNGKKGTPEGHLALARFLTVPVIIDGAVVATVGVANKETDYTDADVMQLTLFMDAVWKLVARKRAEDEHLRLEQQLLHAQKLESLGVLAGGIAHDFNNILTSIIGNTELALLRVKPESPAVENLKRIGTAALRATDLAKQMLAYSGKGKFVLEYLHINNLLEEMLHMLEVSISKKAVLRLNLAQELPTIEGDATQIRQVLMNLVINASDAIGDRSGVIAITTGCMDCDQSYLSGVWLDDNLRSGLYLYIEVADTGCGMDKATMARIFDPFFTTKFSGRGLGMAAVLGIVRGHKGAIKVYSESGKGSSFKLLFPASGKLPQTIDSEPLAEGEWKGSGNVLLVDDEETVRAIGRDILQVLGFQVTTACDGREGVSRFKDRDDWQFVILDLTMPHMDGEQCFRELRRIDPSVRVIMSSGYNEQEVTQRFIGKGSVGFIQKPYNVTAMRSEIRSVLARPNGSTS